jgi:hypothetical protein
VNGELFPADEPDPPDTCEGCGVVMQGRVFITDDDVRLCCRCFFDTPAEVTR